MELFKVAETPSTITIGWSDPPPGTQGYLFFARGKQVSRTFAPGRRSVRFSKGSEPYKVEAVTFVKVGEGTYPSAPVTYKKVAPRVAYKAGGSDARFCLQNPDGTLRPGVVQITEGPNRGKFTDESRAIYTNLDGLDESGIRSSEPAPTSALEIDNRPICSLPTEGDPTNNTGSWKI